MLTLLWLDWEKIHPLGSVLLVAWISPLSAQDSSHLVLDSRISSLESSSFPRKTKGLSDECLTLCIEVSFCGQMCKTRGGLTDTFTV
jgi:hypothetical protein